MRVGLVLDAPAGPALLREAAMADRVGLDLVWVPVIDREGNSRSPTVVAASLAPLAASLRVVVEAIGSHHPIELAEELAVADQLLGGRLGVVFADTEAAALDETLEVLLRAFSARPFRHAGARWSFPAPDETGRQSLIRVTPPPAQFEFPVSLMGRALLETAITRGMPIVANFGDGASDMHRVWAHIDGVNAQAAAGYPRAGLRDLPVPPSLDDDVDPAVSQLESDRHEWGLSMGVIRLPRHLSASERLDAIEVLAARIRPRLQIGDLPAELVESWSNSLPSDSESAQS